MQSFSRNWGLPFLVGQELEDDIEKSRKEILELQNQLRELNAQQAPAESPKEIAALQSQLLDLKAQKAAADTELEQLKSRNEKLSADLAELKGVQERLTALEEVAAEREQTLSQSEQKIADLTHALDQEKKGQEMLRSELSTKADQVAKLEQKLEATRCRLGRAGE